VTAKASSAATTSSRAAHSSTAASFCMNGGTGRPAARTNFCRAREPAAARTATTALAASPTAALASTNVTATVSNQVGSGQPIMAKSASASTATAA